MSTQDQLLAEAFDDEEDTNDEQAVAPVPDVPTATPEQIAHTYANLRLNKHRTSMASHEYKPHDYREVTRLGEKYHVLYDPVTNKPAHLDMAGIVGSAEQGSRLSSYGTNETYKTTTANVLWTKNVVSLLPMADKGPMKTTRLLDESILTTKEKRFLLKNSFERHKIDLFSYVRTFGELTGIYLWFSQFKRGGAADISPEEVTRLRETLEEKNGEATVAPLEQGPPTMASLPDPEERFKTMGEKLRSTKLAVQMILDDKKNLINPLEYVKKLLPGTPVYARVEPTARILRQQGKPTRVFFGCRIVALRIIGDGPLDYKFLTIDPPASPVKRKTIEDPGSATEAGSSTPSKAIAGLSLAVTPGSPTKTISDDGDAPTVAEGGAESPSKRIKLTVAEPTTPTPAKGRTRGRGGAKGKEKDVGEDEIMEDA
ncbi:hypothetical protein SISSUDRAFT_1064776 [Sistotremastrum suecicum HHB10207 ss-3]|uniref:Uncharacterized protein n=1 Tax=Sistotremastrum suecicum HHB10207 ss-3 TaxID=1314776 RepID=A0A166A967_9AGAM|nr:hypothetical protein SISSUDRAFT_1064776 [Sistotremastrum suecicum HHB10207 ss-3]